MITEISNALREPDTISSEDWPEEDRVGWNAAFKAGDLFDDCGPGAHLADQTRQILSYQYGRLLKFLAAQHPDLLALPPAERLDPKIIAQYVACLRQSCRETSVAIYLQNLRHTLRLICPTSDWSWLLAIAKRIAAQATPRPARHHLVTSDRLYKLGIDLMDKPVQVLRTLTSLLKRKRSSTGMD